MDDLLSVKDAAVYLEMTEMTVRRLYRVGILPSLRSARGRMYFRREDVERVKGQQYPQGMSHADIAQDYGVKRTVVIYHFGRLKVKPLGTNRGGNGRLVYDPATVAKFALILGWQLQSQRRESLSPDPATSTAP